MSPRRYRGTAFGLTLASDEPLPGLLAVPEGTPADVTIAFNTAAAVPTADRDAAPWYRSDEVVNGRPWLVVWRAEGFVFEYGEGVVFAIDAAGTSVDASWSSPLTAADAASYLLGPVLAFVLRLRGIVPLHASGVVAQGKALLFVGPAGAGKSSTAAAMSLLGHSVLSDDVVPLRLTAAGLTAGPGHPRLNLWNDTSQSLFGDAPLPTVSSVYQKRYLDLLERRLSFRNEPTPVGTIFVLGDRVPGTEPAVAPISRRDGLLALLANTYGVYLLDPELRAREFAFLSHVAETTPIQQLSLCEGLDELGHACRQLVESPCWARGW